MPVPRSHEVIGDGELHAKFSASLEIGDERGAIVWISNANGVGTPIMISVAPGGVRNDAFGHNPLDWEASPSRGTGALATSDVMPATTRPPEQVTERYYAYTVFNGLQVTPDVQLFFHPALAPNTATAAVFTIRSTFSF